LCKNKLISQSHLFKVFLTANFYISNVNVCFSNLKNKINDVTLYTILKYKFILIAVIIVSYFCYLINKLHYLKLISRIYDCVCMPTRWRWFTMPILLLNITNARVNFENVSAGRARDADEYHALARCSRAAFYCR